MDQQAVVLSQSGCESYRFVHSNGIVLPHCQITFNAILKAVLILVNFPSGKGHQVQGKVIAAEGELKARTRVTKTTSDWFLQVKF